MWQRAFETLAAAGGPAVELMLDSIWARVHRSAAGGKGGLTPTPWAALAGGPTTKPHALVDGLGRLVAFTLTPGQRGDAPVAPDLIALLPASVTLAADRAYDSHALRRLLLARTSGGSPPATMNFLQQMPPPSA